MKLIGRWKWRRTMGVIGLHRPKISIVWRKHWEHLNHTDRLSRTDVQRLSACDKPTRPDSAARGIASVSRNTWGGRKIEPSVRIPALQRHVLGRSRRFGRSGGPNRYSLLQEIGQHVRQDRTQHPYGYAEAKSESEFSHQLESNQPPDKSEDPRRSDSELR